jgi:hypothetical protein
MPQPIDFQTELSRVAAVERVQQIADRLAVNAQQRLAQEIQEQKTLAETQVHEPEAKSGEVEPELKRKNPYVGRRRKREEKPDEESVPAEPVLPPDESHSLDVTI